MQDRFNTIAGWALFSGIVALGLTSLSHRYYGADKNERPEKMGFAIEGVASGEGEAAGPSFEALLAAADPAKGEAVFKKCMACHTVNQGGAAGIGPNLHGIVGGPVGKHAAGFAYSADLAAKGGNWDFTALNEWLTSPKKFAAGTKMTFAGLSNAEERANLIVYLNAQGSNLPLPAAPAAPAKGEAVFKKCASCHTINQGGASGIGPNLHGVFGAAVGKHAAGFAYSADLAGKGGNWDAANLDAWLAAPKKFASGTKMTFAGISDPAQRADLIAYLKAQGGQ